MTMVGQGNSGEIRLPGQDYQWLFQGYDNLFLPTLPGNKTVGSFYLANESSATNQSMCFRDVGCAR